MAHEVRRVVTGHDADGRSIALIDEQAQPLPGSRRIPIWTTEGFPASNDGAADAALREVATTLKDGTAFRIGTFPPGASSSMHRTESVDYVLVLAGAIDMELDTSTVHLEAGDILVQRGTMHRWENRGDEDCVLAFIVIDARPVEVGGALLHATI